MQLEVELYLRIVSEANKRGHWAKGARRASEQRGIPVAKSIALPPDATSWHR